MDRCVVGSFVLETFSLDMFTAQDAIIANVDIHVSARTRLLGFSFLKLPAFAVHVMMYIAYCQGHVEKVFYTVPRTRSKLFAVSSVLTCSC